MKKFRYFILVLAGVAAMMLGGCKDKEKYDESAFQDDLEPLSEDEVCLLYTSHSGFLLPYPSDEKKATDTGSRFCL